ncbi:hypothetical protein AB0467_32665 [Streptomyces sp. NPDC052095]|uniref:hypothetical protein n=1 Tax=unclassified Streptomyces TaxID=2593676 RepID=UPI00344B45E6
MTEDMGSTAAPDRPSRAWIGSLISTLATLPLGLLVLGYGGLSPMACDSCSEAVAHRFDSSFGPAWTALCVLLGLAGVLLAASWVGAFLRPAAGTVLAVLAPVMVFVAWVVFTAMVDWP